MNPTQRRTVTAAPRYATRRTPGRRTYGPAIAKVAAGMGKPLQAWQRTVADVATEVLDDGSWAYDLVVVHVQRQGGKTTLVLPVSAHRTLIKPSCKTWFTAQKRQDARDTWLDAVEILQRSALGDLFTVRRSNGSEALTSMAGGTFRVFAPTEDGLHGKANELVTVDEGWAFDSVEGAGLQQAIQPTFATTGGQLWLPSTAGTAASTWYYSYVTRGRAAVKAGATTGIAYFEWSLPTADAEQVMAFLTELHRHADGARAAVAASASLDTRLDDTMATVLAHHPGEFVRPSVVRSAALDMAPGEFVRAYGNVWTLTSDALISDAAWRDGKATDVDPPAAGELRLAFDVTPTRSHGAVSGAWRDPSTGRPVVDTMDARPGTSWLVERIEALSERYGVTEVSCDAAGPALDIADELERRGQVKVRRVGGREYVAACAAFLAAIDARMLLHRDTPALNQAVAAAAKRDLGDTWVWARRQSAGPIAALVAATVALWLYDHRETPAAGPTIAVRTPAQQAAPQVVTTAPKRSTSTFLSV